jgi:hypothetical protein
MIFFIIIQSLMQMEKSRMIFIQTFEHPVIIFNLLTQISIPLIHYFPQTQFSWRLLIYDYFLVLFLFFSIFFNWDNLSKIKESQICVMRSIFTKSHIQEVNGKIWRHPKLNIGYISYELKFFQRKEKIFQVILNFKYINMKNVR